MMKENVSVGRNRTGIDLSPVDKRELLEATEATVPSMEGDVSEIADVRSEYLEQGVKLGSVPPPATVKGMAKEAFDALKGGSPSLLMDKLSERLAFERTGTRLYEALITKLENSERISGGPSVEALRLIQTEELRHFELVRDTILELGGDPTTVTPAADVIAVSSLGLIQVLADPRMSFSQSLEAILTAELVDNDGWSLLIRLTKSMGHPMIAQRFEKALASEEEHLAKVRGWIHEITLGKAGPGPAAKESISATVKNVVADVAKSVTKSVAKDTAKDTAKKPPR